VKSLAHCLLTVAAVYAVTSLTRSARADEPPRVAVVEARKVTLPPKLGDQPVRAAGASGVRQAGAELVDAGRAGAACADEACWAKVAGSTGASHVLFIDATYGRLSYKLAVSLWSAVDRERRTPATAECTTCPAKDMLAKITELSEQVVAAEKARRPAAPAAVEIAAPAPPAVEASPAPVASSPIVDTSANAEPRDGGGSRVLAYSLLGGGAAVAGAGVVLWALDGRKSRCERDPAGGGEVCLDTMKTKSFAIPIALIGAAGLVWGGVEWWRSREPRVAVAIGPSSLVISGSF
jgi:hypothetical protein